MFNEETQLFQFQGINSERTFTYKQQRKRMIKYLKNTFNLEFNSDIELNQFLASYYEQIMNKKANKVTLKDKVIGLSGGNFTTFINLIKTNLSN